MTLSLVDVERKTIARKRTNRTNTNDHPVMTVACGTKDTGK